MKIAFFLPTLNFGGIEANSIRLANSLLESKYDVEFVLGIAEGEYLDRLNRSFKVINFKEKSSIKMIKPLAKYMRENNPDIVYTGGEGANIIVMIAKFFSPKTKVIISIRTNLTTEYKESQYRRKKILYPLLSKYLYKRAEGIIAVSKGVADNASAFLKLPRNKISVIYNPIIDDELYEMMEKEVDHQWLKNDNYKVIISVGRLVNQKNFKYLIKVFKEVNKEKPYTRLIILGEGPEKEMLQELIEEYELQNVVSLLGFVQNPYKYMKSSDLFVLSSKWEGFGNVIVEALATGLPIVSTNCPNGPDEILDYGKYGRLVEMNDVHQMKLAILKELEFPLIDRITREKRANHFSVEIAKEKYLELFDDIKKR